jgi:predicted amidohydrolase
MGVGPEAIADGFLPDTISTDVYNRHLGWTPPHDLPRTISRMIAIGMSETDALARATLRPAQVLGMAGEVGTLAPGAVADLAVLRWSPGPEPLADVADGVRSGPCLEPVLTVRAGRVVRP